MLFFMVLNTLIFKFEIVRGMTRGFIGLEFHGILTENFICGYLA